MKRFLNIMLAGLMLLSVCGCTSQETVDQVSSNITLPLKIEDIATGLDGLGYNTVFNSIKNEFMAQKSYQLVLNDNENLSIYVYKNSQKAMEVSSGFSADGFSYVVKKGEKVIGGACYEWINPPHFYRIENVIIFFLGTDKNILSDLESLYGSQFAGLSAEQFYGFYIEQQ